MLFKSFIMSLVINHISSYFICTNWVPMIKKKQINIAINYILCFGRMYIQIKKCSHYFFFFLFNTCTIFPKIRELNAFCPKHLLLLSHFDRLHSAAVSHMISCSTLPLSGPEKNCVRFLLYHEWYRQMSPES